MGELRVIAGGSADLPVFVGRTADALHGISEDELSAFAGLEVVEGPGGRIKRAREALGKARGRKFTQKELAEAIGISKAAVTQWELGLTNPHKTYRAKLAATLEVDEAWLFAEPRGTGPAGDAGWKRTPQKTITPTSRSATLPVRGTVLVEDGDFAFTGQVVEYRRRPPSLSESMIGYGFLMRGNAMNPVFEEGRLVYVDPTRPCQIGDYAVIELATDDGPPPVIVRRITFRTPDKIELWQATPDKRFEIEAAQIAHMHRILHGEDLI